ncbi:MAG TPA: BamA/TamA family outer membrane protein [Burkholderiaceae bacterium]|nr:BamA/TamA family outer membrane protein [Burkholderiaceae bacterium]
MGGFFADPEAPSADGTRVAPHYALEVEAPEPIARQIREFTLLGRWRRRPDFDRSQLPLFVRRAPAEVRELLAAEGWFAPAVAVETFEGGVRIRVETGPRTLVDEVDLRLGGPVADGGHEPLLERARREWPLPAGSAFRSPDWERAKRGVLQSLQDGGFLRARVVDSDAIVDAERHRASVAVEVDSGPRLRFGETEVGGLQRYPEVVVQGLRPFEPGEPYEARGIVEFQRRLNGAGWFTTANVRPDTAALERDPDLEAVPVRVDVVERETKRWTLGGGYDTDRGFSVLTAWDHRDVAGLGIQSFNGVELDLQRQLAYSTWETPQGLDGGRWQAGVRAEHRDVRNDIVDAASVFGSRLRRRDDIETAVSLQWQGERQSIVFAPGDERRFDARALVLGWTWTQRRLDSPIFPTRGWVASVQLSGASEAIASERSFGRAYGYGFATMPLATERRGEFGRLVVRGEIGGVAAGGRDGIPSANLFRTGGTRSVRGYGAQAIGVPIGEAVVAGRYLLVGSLEYQHLITREIALAAFVDRGGASDERRALRPVSGWGAGVRLRTPVGPLHFDVARGEAAGGWRVHFSIGVVF